MTRYVVVKSQPYIEGVVNVTYPHGEQPEDGFATATGANLWILERDLDGRWYVQPIAGTA